MSFADLETRVNTAVMGSLANARAVFAPGAAAVPVVFDVANGGVEDMGLQMLEPSLVVMSSLVPNVMDGDPITVDMPQLQINSAPYLVRRLSPMAEGGMLRVTLARAA